jgi:chlorite dismutase
LNERELKLATSLGRGVIQPVYSFVSMTEISEYVSQDKDYDRTLREKNGLSPDSPEYQQKMKQFKDRIQGYIEERLHPRVPDHRVMCFYPMNKKRGPSENWYRLSFDDRKRLMASHAITGRKYRDSVKQLVTGAVGLDDWEWGVTLFSDDPFYLKKIVYEMRYDEASARYGEFRPFLIGLTFEPVSLLRRLVL